MSLQRMSVLVLLCVIATTLTVDADLRMASQPSNGWKVIQRSKQFPFNQTISLYMEPSVFGYAGLIKQRDGEGYDQFLRSNIDNEQDKRNFQTEDGKDHLPFRSYEGASVDSSTADPSIKTKIPATSPGAAITATPGVAFIVPLRWNNPHSSELEVNIWVSSNKYVVPIRRPTCSGEGYQDNVFAFTVPSDFNSIGSIIPGWTGCKKVGDCVLQVYAHSVETRQYAMGTPLIVTGTVPAATATTTTNIKPAGVDVGQTLSKLTRDTCLSSSSDTANIITSVPRFARLISDVSNHAYQNSDYSPYSGQQPEAISRNLQAACIVKMVTGNRGELGKTLLKRQNPDGAAFQIIIDKQVNDLIKKYEGITNAIIALIGNDMKTQDLTVVDGKQKSASCFRCAEVGAVVTNRLLTNTYIPSFQIPSALIEKSLKLVPAAYSGLVSSSGLLQIYVNVLKDMTAQFTKAKTLKLEYQGPVLKTTLATAADIVNFKKIDYIGKPDWGMWAAYNFNKNLAENQAAALKAAGQAVSSLSAASVAMSAAVTTTASSYNLLAEVGDSTDFPPTGATDPEEEEDMYALRADNTCDNDKTYTDGMTCSAGKVMFARVIPASPSMIAVVGAQPTSANAAISVSSAMTSAVSLSTFVATACALAFLL